MAWDLCAEVLSKPLVPLFGALSSVSRQAIFRKGTFLCSDLLGILVLHITEDTGIEFGSILKGRGRDIRHWVNASKLTEIKKACPKTQTGVHQKMSMPLRNPW